MRLSNTRGHRKLPIVAAVLVFAGCASAATVSGQRNTAASYRASELEIIATGANELRTIVIGNPTDRPKAEFDATVLEQLATGRFGQRLNLSANPKQEDPRRRHVIVVFNLANVGDADDLCSFTVNNPPALAQNETLNVAAAYCAGDFPLTYATGSGDSAQVGPLINQLASSLFPRQKRRDRRK